MPPTTEEYEEEYGFLPPLSSELRDEAKAQVQAAEEHLDRPVERLVEWPYGTLSAITGPMGPGEVWFVAGFSGGGKTTFITSCIDAWRKDGKRAYVLPLELDPFRFRTYLACLETGIPAGDALSGRLRSDPERREHLKSALRGQCQPPYTDLVRVSSQRFINKDGLVAAAKEAVRFGADVVVVDHIDHIEGGDGTNLYAESKAVNTIALKLAQHYGLLFVFTSQLNLDIARSPDKLAKYQPPQPQHLLLPSAKLFNATGILGLFRPLRSPDPLENTEEYVKAIKEARAGHTEAHTVLAPWTMGVNAMKLRNYGQHEGRRTLLKIEHGRVVEIPERDRFIVTGNSGRERY